MYREELKFVCHQHKLDILNERLKSVMIYDLHQIGENYRIRSLYFDDCYDSAFYENDAGVDDRRKFRIRVYDDPRKSINLEIKYKYKGKTLKESCQLTEDVYNSIIDCNLEFEVDFPNPLLQLYLEINNNLMKPAVIVEYERTAFIYENGNTRVTFDRNIGYSKDFESFLDMTIPLIPLLQSNQHVLEVKYDDFLPDYIAQLLETGDMQRVAFSKYYLSRMHEKGENEYDFKVD